MRYFLDFEACRFNNRIISVGCVTETGAEFYSLVKSCKASKVDSFITALTGITPEMIAAAPSPDTVFTKLYYFILQHDDGNRPEYYVYGDSDMVFLKATLNTVRDIKASICIQALIGGLVDYGLTTKEFFGLGQDIGLKKAYLVVNKELNDFVQEHDALADAKMLRSVAMNLPEACSEADRTRLAAIPTQPKPFPTKKKVTNPLWTEWLELDHPTKWQIETHADSSSWQVKAMASSGDCKYFNSLEDAAIWLMWFNFVHNCSPRKQGDIDKIIKNIKKSKHFCGLFWYIKEEK